MKESEGHATESPQSFAFWIVFAATVGFLAVLLPIYFQNREVPPFRFFETVTYAIEKQTYWTLILLFGVGMLIGWRSPRLWGWKCSATMLLFPVIAVLEMILYPKSHTLFPLEFVIYAAQTIPALAGGYTGVAAWKRLGWDRESGS